MTAQKPQPEGQTQQNDETSHQNWGHEIQRLKQDYATRQSADRPTPHSIEVAYRQVIASYERNRRSLDKPE